MQIKARTRNAIKAAGQTPLTDTFAKSKCNGNLNPGVDQKQPATATAQLKFNYVWRVPEGATNLLLLRFKVSLVQNETVYLWQRHGRRQIHHQRKKSNGDIVFGYTGVAKMWC